MKSAKNSFVSQQEEFWSGDFGEGYRDRNKSDQLVRNSINRFSKIVRNTPNVGSIAEFGCNIGNNLVALKALRSEFSLAGFEINANAAQIARERTSATIIETTIAAPMSHDQKFDLTFTSGVLIHINPTLLPIVYENLYNLSKKYIVVCEYYNPTPMVIPYRGHEDRLFKRDFAGELIDKYDLKLIDYGFSYHRDNYFPEDDVTWFVLEK